ncbi:MAG: type II secretion system protein [Armatimonadetes bacterium]|nr:type II secretion system protein [Armatimonadota bacterium]
MRSEAGFTLVEVLVALGLVALVFTVLLVATSAGLGKVREAERETAAAAWVQGAMEAAMTLGVKVLPSPGRYDAVEALKGLPPLPHGTARAEMVIRQVSERPVLKEVTVAVYPTMADTAPAFELSTLIGARPGR